MKANTIDNAILLIPTFHKRHIYMEEVGRIVNAFFPKEMKRIILSDKELSVNGFSTLISEKRYWTEILLDGLLMLDADSDYIFLMLEDLVPFDFIDEKILENQILLMKKYQYKKIAFRTYEFGNLNYDFVVDGLNFHKVPDTFLYYCQLQPALWNRQYLVELLKKMINSGVKSPWEFEFFKSEEIHLMSEYKWPNVLGGFIVDGRVNKKAINALDDNLLFKPLKDLLTRKFILEQPKLFFRRLANHLKKKSRGKSAHA